MRKTTLYLDLLIKEGGAGLLNARNKVIIIIPNIAHSAVEMWIVTVD